MWLGDCCVSRQPRLVEVTPNPNGSLWLFISSGDGDEYPGCRLSVAAFKRYVSIRLPPVIKPEQKRVYPNSAWDAATVARLGRNWYWDYTERQYGASLGDNFLNVSLGRVTNDSSTEQRWGCFLPWGEWRFVRHSFYGLAGEHLWTQLERDRKRGIDGYEAMREAERAIPKATFCFKDFDGEEIRATTHIEEREWLRGAKWCAWLSWFYAPKIRRSLDIKFSAETGPRKGSWKGGTTGHGIDMRPGELHESAFRRYCAEHRMTFVERAA